MEGVCDECREGSAGGWGLQVDGVCSRGTQPSPQQSLTPGTSWSGTNSEGVFLSLCFPVRSQLPGEAPEC